MREVAIVFWVVFAVAAVKAVHGTDPLSVFSALIAFGAAGTVTAKAGVTVKHDGTVGDQDLFRIVLAAAMAVAALLFVWAAMCADDLKRLLIASAFAFGIAVVWSYAAGRRRVLTEHEERKRRAAEQAAEAAARQRQEAEEREWQAAARAEERTRQARALRDEDDQSFLGKAQALLSQAGSTSRRVTVRGGMGGGEVEVTSESDARVEAELRSLEERRQQLLQLRDAEW